MPEQWRECFDSFNSARFNLWCDCVRRFMTVWYRSRMWSCDVVVAVSASDFPSSDFVRRRLQQFQKSFVSHVTRLFSTLPLDVRLSSLALAVRALTHESRYVHVTLADFLQTTTTTTTDEQSTALSSDFLERCAAGGTEFAACVPDALFPGITRARHDKVWYHAVIHVMTLDKWLKQMVKVIWHKTASPPHTDRSVVFARLRQFAPPSNNTWLLGPPESTSQLTSRSV